MDTGFTLDFFRETCYTNSMNNDWYQHCWNKKHWQIFQAFVQAAGKQEK